MMLIPILIKALSSAESPPPLLELKGTLQPACYVIFHFMVYSSSQSTKMVANEKRSRARHAGCSFSFHFILYSLNTVTPSAKAALQGAVTKT